MRCKYCGSQSLHPATEHKNFSVGKAAVGAFMIGTVGVVGGLIGKDIKGYRCAACGQFLDAPMDLLTEHQIDNAIADAESGRTSSMFYYYQRQFPNIQATIPFKSNSQPTQISLPSTFITEQGAGSDGTVPVEKHIYRNLRWNPASPIYIQKVSILTSTSGDALSLEAWNQSNSIIRSAYFSVTVYDDTGDEIGRHQFVYQGLSVPPGSPLPEEKVFPLETDLAYRVEAVCEKAAFTDDSVWRSEQSSDNYPLSDQPELTPDNFPRLKYVRQHIKEVSKIDADKTLFLPIELESYWQCVCGQPVSAGNRCMRCGAEWVSLNHLFSQEYIRQLQQEHVKAVAAERASATMKLYKDAVEHEKQVIYEKASGLQGEDSETSLAEADKLFERIQDYKDSAKRAITCQSRILEIQQENELREKEEQESRKRAKREALQKKKRNRKVGIIAGIASAACIGAILLLLFLIIPSVRYSKGNELLSAGSYSEAMDVFSKIENYKDANQLYADAFTSLRNSYKEKGDDYLHSGDNLHAAIMYIKAGENGLAKHTYDFSTKLVAAEMASLGVSENGVLYFQSNNEYLDRRSKQSLSGITTISSVSDFNGVAGIDSNGMVIVSDANFFGRDIREEVLSWQDVVALDCGSYQTFGLLENGTVVGVFENANDTKSENYYPVDDSYRSWTNIVEIGTYNYGLWGLDRNGKLYYAACQKPKASSHFNLEEFDSGVEKVVFDNFHLIGLKDDNTLVYATDRDGKNVLPFPVIDCTNVIDFTVSEEWIFTVRNDGHVNGAYFDEDSTSYDYSPYINAVQSGISGWSEIIRVQPCAKGIVGIGIDGSVHYQNLEHSYDETKKQYSIKTTTFDSYVGQKDKIEQWSDVIFVSSETWYKFSGANVLALHSNGTVSSLETGKYYTFELIGGKATNDSYHYHSDGTYDQVGTWKLWG